MAIRADEYVARIIVIVALLYVPYYFTARSFFGEEKTAVVACPVTIAATVITKYDGEGGDTERRRFVAVRCDYAAAGVPEPKSYSDIGRDSIYFENGHFHRFSEIANKRKNITEGDTFSCTAKWTVYKALPLTNPRTGDPRTVLMNCRVATRS